MDPRFIVAFVVLVLLAGAWLALRRRKPQRGSGAKAITAPPELVEPILRSKAAVRAIVSDLAEVFEVIEIGAVGISARHFAIWTFVMTDADRDRLKATPGLEDRLRDAVARAGYPADAVPYVGFAFESKETVDRDFKGNFWYAMQ